MNVSQVLETEEQLTCLFISLYHPQHAAQGVFRLLPGAGGGRVLPADEPVRFGRDPHACTFALADPRVSRKQLSVQAFRAAGSPDLRFTVQSLSQRGRLSVNGAPLAHLERADVGGGSTLVRFGDYEMLLRAEQGEARADFEVLFEVLGAPPSCGEAGPPSAAPVMESGWSAEPSDLSRGPVDVKGPAERQGPMESDETLPFQM